MSNLSCSYSSRITPLLPARRGLVDEGRTGRVTGHRCADDGRLATWKGRRSASSFGSGIAIHTAVLDQSFYFEASSAAILAPISSIISLNSDNKRSSLSLSQSLDPNWIEVKSPAETMPKVTPLAASWISMN